MITQVKLGDTVYIDVITRNPSTGVPQDGDTIPTCDIYEDANDTPIFSPTVTKRTGQTGHYRTPISFTTGNGCEVGKSYNAIFRATISTISDKVKIATCYIQDPKRPTSTVASDVGNTTTTFKTNLTESTTDYWKDALLLFVTGNLINQVKKISGYNGSTKFITVNGGFTSVPSNADVFTLINF